MTALTSRQGPLTRSTLVTNFFNAFAKRLREGACSDGMLTSGTLDKHQSLIDGLFEVAEHELFLFDLAFESQRTLESDTEVRGHELDQELSGIANDQRLDVSRYLHDCVFNQSARRQRLVGHANWILKAI